MTRMTESGDWRQGRRKTAVRWVLTAVLLAPPLVLWFMAAASASAHKSPTDWQGNHETKVGLQNAILIIVGAPALGALLGAVYGAVRRSPYPAATTAGGALLGAVGLWAYGVYELYQVITHVTIVF
jgi:hypothetical protein